MSWSRTWVVAWLLLGCSVVALANPYLTWTVRVTAVPRGDAIIVDHEGRKVTVELHGIDCPDSRGPLGAAAQKRLGERVLGKQVTIRMIDSPRSSRRAVQGEVFLSNGDRPLNEELVAAGLAWWSRPQAPDSMKLAELEATARRAGRGLWKVEPRPSPPWLKKKKHSRRGRRKKPASVKVAAISDEDLSCTTDHDCVLLPTVCPRCAPCNVTWRPVANRAARHRVRRQQGIVDCPAPRCPSCAASSNWRSARPLCSKGRCTLEGMPPDPPFRGDAQTKLFHARGCADYRCPSCTAGFKSVLDALLARYRAHGCVKDSAARPPAAARRSQATACRRDRDCVFAFHPCSPCPSCDEARWRSVTNRRTYRRQAARYRKRRVKCAKCQPCPEQQRSLWLGSKAACVKRQCVAR